MVSEEQGLEAESDCLRSDEILPKMVEILTTVGTTILPTTKESTKLEEAPALGSLTSLGAKWMRQPREREGTDCFCFLEVT
jgi:hypothetical protein